MDLEYILFVCNARTGRDIWLNRVRGGVPPENRCRFFRALQVGLKYGSPLHLNFDASDEEDTRRAKEEIPSINRAVLTLRLITEDSFALDANTAVDAEVFEGVQNKGEHEKGKSKGKEWQGEGGERENGKFGPGWSGLRTFLSWEC